MSASRPAFTLLEMVVVLAIAALVVGLGAGAVMQWEEETTLRKAVSKAEVMVVQAMTRSMNATGAQTLQLGELACGVRLEVRRAGAADFVPAVGQRLLITPGGLCEPLSLRWRQKESQIVAMPDPLTGVFTQMEEWR